jgi:hypothetical protein
MLLIKLLCPHADHCNLCGYTNPSKRRHPPPFAQDTIMRNKRMLANHTARFHHARKTQVQLLQGSHLLCSRLHIVRAISPISQLPYPTRWHQFRSFCLKVRCGVHR